MSIKQQKAADVIDFPCERIVRLLPKKPEPEWFGWVTDDRLRGGGRYFTLLSPKALPHQPEHTAPDND